MIQQFWRICLPFVIALLAAGKFHPLVPLMPNKNQQCWHTLKPSCDREEVMFCTRFHAPPPLNNNRSGTPATIVVGCDPEEPHGFYCSFWAGHFTRMLFPRAHIEIVPLTKNLSHQARQVDLFFGHQHAGDGCDPEMKEKQTCFDEVRKKKAAPLLDALHPSGWKDGILWPPNQKVRSHAKRRPFSVAWNYEQGTFQIDRWADVNIAHWLLQPCRNKLAPNMSGLSCPPRAHGHDEAYSYEDEFDQAPTIYMPETFTDFG